MTKKSVFVLATGGTISMQKTASGYAPESGYLAKALAKFPELQNADMPSYTIQEFEKPIDSANMLPGDWLIIAQYIKENYDQYDGFLVLHGTDTMAYTASALSFMLENLKKPVILTGSQLPLFETRNDARENLINALFLAGNYNIPEVCIYFHNKLFRGNRATKMDASSFAAFASPNFPVLGRVGTEIRVRRELFIKPDEDKSLSLQAIQPVVINTLRLFPGISLDLLQHVLRPPVQALILETYGVGNAPQDKKFLHIIEDAINRGIIIVNCSQCPYAKVRMSDYATGAAILRAGVVSAGDMTVEAAITKLFYVFSKSWESDRIKNAMMTSLRGELTL